MSLTYSLQREVLHDNDAGQLTVEYNLYCGDARVKTYAFVDKHAFERGMFSPTITSAAWRMFSEIARTLGKEDTIHSSATELPIKCLDDVLELMECYTPIIHCEGNSSPISPNSHTPI